jgi:hypothetical protein
MISLANLYTNIRKVANGTAVIVVSSLLAVGALAKLGTISFCHDYATG